MSEINMQISVTHLTQMDRHQNDTHRAPMVHQAQNAQMAEDETTRRMNMPVEPDSIEKKNIDPDRKRQSRHGHKRTREVAVDKKKDPQQPGGTSSLIDISV